MEQSALEEDQFYHLATRYLVPLFPGSSARWVAAKPAATLVASTAGGQRVLVRADRSWTRRIELHRTQPFTRADKRLVLHFVQSAKEIVSALETPAEASALRSLVEHVIARDVVGTRRRSLALAMLETAGSWSLRTYEGREIVCGFGLLYHKNASAPSRRRAELAFANFIAEPHAPVLSNGFETILVFSDRGGDPPSLDLLPQEKGDAPHRFARAAYWASGARLAVCLTRAREVLVFGQRSLLYARRNGSWVAFDREAAIKRWTSVDLSVPTMLRSSIYDTCLDISFARTGGCVGLVEAARRDNLEKVVAADDLLSSSTTDKARLLRQIVNGREFTRIPREIRLELASMDGALVVDRDGTVLAAGAILQVPGGSTGGGRKAAAQALARAIGIGIKISSDGGLEVFAGEDATSRYTGFAPFSPIS